jgi:hypothetical protein
VAKIASKLEDDHEDRALATVLGSIKIPPELAFPSAIKPVKHLYRCVGTTIRGQSLLWITG